MVVPPTSVRQCPVRRSATIPEQVTAFRCATARDIDAVCRQIAFASRFVGSPPQPSLFTAPLPGT